MLAVAAIFAFTPAQAQTSGGPDLYGYQWVDSNDPNGPAYTWIDITGLPGAVQISGITDDNSVGPFNFGFDFRYYWIDVNTFKFGSNGWIGLGAQGNIGNIAHCFPVIPTQGGAGDNFVAPMLTDLNYVSSYPNQPNPASAWYWTNNTDSLVIQYNDVPWWDAGVPDWIGSNTFQVVFSALDSSITVNYNDMDPASFNNIAGCAQDLTIGIENVTGNIGLEHSLEVVPADQYSVKYFPPATVIFQVPDATPAWAANSDNAGQLYVSPSNVNFDANVASVGNADITTDITVDGQLQTLAFQTVWSDQTSVPGGLTAGSNQTVTFPTVANLTTAGQYYFNVATSNGQDLNQTNDNNTVEVSVVECINDAFTMTYATGNPPDGLISWGGGGGDGAGVFFDPPGNPVTLESVELYIVGDQDPNTPMSPFWIKIYDDTGVPGALLDSVYVGVAAVVEDAWNTVNLSAPLAIQNGGFYVSWIMGGDTIGLGTEAFGPISRRTYEVLGGNWSPYRQAQAEDFLIRVNATGCNSFVAVDAPEANFELQTYPNPAAESFKIRFDLPNAGAAQFTMMDMIGQTVFRRELDVNAGSTTFTYNASELSNGVYFLSMQFNGQKVTRKVVVSK